MLTTWVLHSKVANAKIVVFERQLAMQKKKMTQLKKFKNANRIIQQGSLGVLIRTPGIPKLGQTNYLPFMHIDGTAIVTMNSFRECCRKSKKPFSKGTKPILLSS